jgi:thioredoxin-related protein
MSEQVTKRIETAANVAIIIVALATILVFAKNYFVKPRLRSQGIVTGAKLDAEHINWNTSQENVVLALSTACHYCKESSGFYRRLVQECQRRHIRTVAFFPQTEEEGRAYLTTEGVSVDVVRHADFRALRITGTPTLLLVDGHGAVQSVWFGKLTNDKEKEVLALSPS